MYSVTFTYHQTKYDEQFQLLDNQINCYAESLSGFIGKESWQSFDGSLQSSVYYWHDKAALEDFAKYPSHVEAKKHYNKWYQAYRVVIAKIEKIYGDGNLDTNYIQSIE